jgi:hypothetical protein
LTLLTAEHEEAFKQIGDIATELRTGAMKNASFKPVDWYQERLNVLTGCFMYVSTAYGKIKATRDNNEVSAYIKSKMDSQVAGDKFVSAVGEREARHSVNDLVEAEKVLESYKEASEQGILTCKKIIDVLSIEMQRERN